MAATCSPQYQRCRWEQTLLILPNTSEDFYQALGKRNSQQGETIYRCSRVPCRFISQPAWHKNETNNSKLNINSPKEKKKTTSPRRPLWNKAISGPRKWAVKTKQTKMNFAYFLRGRKEREKGKERRKEMVESSLQIPSSCKVQACLYRCFDVSWTW